MRSGLNPNTIMDLAVRAIRRCTPASMVALLILVLLWGPVLAAEQTTEENKAAQPTYEVPVDEFGRNSPRGTVKGFLEACREGDYKKASNYLDLRRISGDGPTLARKLRTVLSRTLWVDVETLSQDPKGTANDGLPSYRDRLGTIDIKDGEVDILLQRVPRGDGVFIWKFAGVTVSKVPGLYTELGYGVLERFLPQFFFDIQFLDIALWQWIGLLVLVLLAAVVSWLLAVMVVRTIGALVARTKTSIDDRLFEVSISPIRLAIGALIFRGGIVPLGLGMEAVSFLSALLRALFIVAVTWLLVRVSDVLSSAVEERLVERGQVSATALVSPGRKVVKVILLILAFVAILDTFGFNVAALLAGLGVGGIAVALAAQKTIENLFGGVTLYTDKPVRVGDFCRFGEQIGTVEEIGVRSTRVRTLDRTLITIPNSTFSSMQLENFTKRDRIRLYTIFGVRYETTPDQMRYILVEIRKLLYSHERVLDDPARIRFINFGAHSLDLEIFAYVDTSDWGEFLGIREDIFLRIMDIIEQSGSGFAFPSQTLYLGKDDGLNEEKVREVAAEVQRWREGREIFLPDFPPSLIEELKDTLRYPPEGSPGYQR